LKWYNQSSLFICLFGIGFTPLSLLSQNQNLPINQSFSFDIDNAIVGSSKIVHESFKPILASEARKVDSNLFLSPTLNNLLFNNKRFVSRKLFYEHFISLDTGNILLTIDPLVNFELGEDFKEEREDINRYYKNTRGFNLKLSIGDKVSFESSFLENQAVLPYYLDLRAKNSNVVFGQGRWKSFGDNGYDYAMASGYFSYSIANWVTLQAGHGKHFIGNGHRSLLLSDLSFNYPYIRLITSWFNNKLQYQTLLSSYQNLNRLQSADPSEGLFERKQAASHYIEYSPSSSFSFAFFESVVFPTITSTGNKPVGVNFWIPIIGLNSLIEGKGSMGNILWGTNMKYNLFKKIQLYNQVSVLDENFDKLSIQLGGKLFLANSFLIQFEGNKIGKSIENNLFHHYNESLTHPLLENTTELLGLIQFKQNRFISRLSYNLISSDAIDIQYLDLKQSVIINPTFNFAFNIGIQYRMESAQNENLSSTLALPLARDEESIFFYVGISTNLQNLYFDY